MSIQKTGRRRATRVSLNTSCKMNNELVDIFKTVQHNTSYHERCLQSLMTIYENTEEKIFFKDFISCLEISLQIGEKNPKVERSLDFAARFCTSFLDASNEEAEMHPFMRDMFSYLLKYHNSKSPAFRYRVCQYINKILQYLGGNAELDDNLCDEILDAMLERLRDVKHQVRTQAVIALQRLQNPTDPNDRVTRYYLFHISSDPNPQVRRAVVNNLARSAAAAAAVMQRTHDVDDKVRRDAYTFLSLYTFKTFKIRQRIELLKNGIRDRSAIVSKCVIEVLVPKWLVFFERSYFELLKGLKLDASVSDLKESIEVSDLLLEVFFKTSSTEKIISVLPLNENKLLDLSQLNHETVLYWRCLASFFYKQGDVMEDSLETILPELTNFCNYIRSFCDAAKTDMDKWEQLVFQSILNQLFQITTFYDLSDEVGRCTLKTLILDLLLKTILFDYVIITMLDIYSKIIPNAEQRIKTLAEVISEIVEPLQIKEVETEAEARRRNVQACELRLKLNILIDEEETAVSVKDYAAALLLKDQISEIRSKIKEISDLQPVTQEVRTKTEDEYNLTKALDIIIGMLLSSSLKELTPELRALHQHFITDCSKMHEVAKIEARAMRCLGMCGYLDINLGKSVMPLMYARLMAHSYIGAGSLHLVHACLAGVIDLLLLYGLENFPDAEHTENSINKTKRTLYDNTMEEEIEKDENITSFPISTSSNEIVSCILSFLDNEVVEIRTLAAKGLCLLLVSGKIKAANVLSRLIILWFNPATDQDVELRQIVGTMLSFFANNTINSQDLIERAFLPTMRTVFAAPHSSPLSEIDVDAVLRFMITHTHSGFRRNDTINIHNNLAIIICEEMVKNPESHASGFYAKCLPTLEITEDDTGLKNDLYNLCMKIAAVTQSKISLKHIRKFIEKLTNTARVTESSPTSINYPVTTQEDNTSERMLRVMITPISEKDMQKLVLNGSTWSAASKAIQSMNTPGSQTTPSGTPKLTEKNVVISTSESDSSENAIESSSSDSEFEFRRPASTIRLRTKKRLKY